MNEFNENDFIIPELGSVSLAEAKQLTEYHRKEEQKCKQAAIKHASRAAEIDRVLRIPRTMSVSGVRCE